MGLKQTTKMRGKESWRTQLRRAALELAPKENKGIVYATRFETALESLMERRTILGWRATERGSEEDQRGIDYFIEAGNQIIPIQITSTSNQARKRKKRLRKERRLIPVLYLVEKKGAKRGEIKSVRKVKGEIIRVITSYLGSTA